ncbi:restriction endonuclease subunit S [Campylobacter concisus]|uniref:restriction endonuclease subunit S n=1 Tax=Campylobacter concisus TaxID=199 RepID=UPI003D1E088E
MKWEIKQIEEICTIVTSGGTPKSTTSSFYYPKEVPWLKTGEVNYCRIYDTETYISKEGLARSSAKLIPENSVIVAMYGNTAGRVAINKIQICTNQACCNLVINHDIADYQYVYYVLSNMYDKLVSLKNGAAQLNLNARALKAFEISFPDIETQKKIGQTLSAYDDLIENNQKQIKLLEEAAQRLYKEWFVDFRFPGYEDTKFIDGIPEGWRKYRIDDIFKIKYGKTLSTSKINKIGKYPVYGANGVIGYYNEKNCNDYVVLITSRGNGSGDVSRTHDKESFVTNNSFLVNPFNVNYRLSYVHQLIKTINFKNICTGSAQPQLTNNSISMLSAIVASDELVGRFCDVGDLLYEKIDNILKQNILLTQARDRLLPKLMSGEIEV